MRIFNNYKCFDKESNTFKLSHRKIADHLNVSASSVYRLIKYLIGKNLVREVEFLSEKCLMLCPSLVYRSDRREYWWFKAVFFLTSYEKALEWSDMCWKLGHMIDPETGEEMPKKSPIYCLDPTRKYKNISNRPMMFRNYTNPYYEEE